MMKSSNIMAEILKVTGKLGRNLKLQQFNVIVHIIMFSVHNLFHIALQFSNVRILPIHTQ